jgi:hypothetical protein
MMWSRLLQPLPAEARFAAPLIIDAGSLATPCCGTVAARRLFYEQAVLQ